MMIKLKRLFKQIAEQSTRQQSDIEILSDPAKAKEVEANATKIAAAVGKVKDAITTEEVVDEARLVNHVHEYRGGVEYVLRDPSTAKSVVAEITRWTERKGFTIVNREITKQGRVGYFYFRMGEDPGTEAQRIQGYFSQMPEIKKFRFKVRDEQPTQPTRQQTPQAPQPEI
jgi:hypothetical protein